MVSFQAEREQSSFREILINKKKEINVLENMSVDTESCLQVILTLFWFISLQGVVQG